MLLIVISIIPLSFLLIIWSILRVGLRPMPFPISGCADCANLPMQPAAEPRVSKEQDGAADNFSPHGPETCPKEAYALIQQLPAAQDRKTELSNPLPGGTATIPLGSILSPDREALIKASVSREKHSENVTLPRRVKALCAAAIRSLKAPLALLGTWASTFQNASGQRGIKSLASNTSRFADSWKSPARSSIPDFRAECTPALGRMLKERIAKNLAGDTLMVQSDTLTPDQSTPSNNTSVAGRSAAAEGPRGPSQNPTIASQSQSASHPPQPSGAGPSLGFLLRVQNAIKRV